MYLYVLGRVELANGTADSKNQPRKHERQWQREIIKAKRKFLRKFEDHIRMILMRGVIAKISQVP